MTPEEIKDLTHSQCLFRMEEITAEVARIADKTELTRSDEAYRDQLASEFDLTDGRRARLEAEAEAARMKAVQDTLAGRGSGRVEDAVPQPRRSGFGPATSSRGDYDRDAILEPDSIDDRRFRNPWDMSEVRTFGRDPGDVSHEFRSRALSAVEKMPGANDHIRDAATNIIERWDNSNADMSRLCLATSSPEYLRAWSKWMRSGGNSGNGVDYTDTEKRALADVGALMRAMSLTPSAGGYLVPFQLDPTVIITANGSRNQIRTVARQVVATGNVWNGVSSGAVSWSWDAEATEVSDDATTFAQPSIPIYKAAGFVPISFEAREDAANITQDVSELLAFGKDALEASAFSIGSGTGQPTGIVTALTGTSSKLSPGTAGTFALADVYTLDSALPSRYRANASWLAHRGTYNKLRQFDTSGGAGLWATIGQGQPPALMSRPALEAEDMTSVLAMTTTATSHNYVAVYGDFNNYVIADRIGMQVDFIPHLFGASARRPTGQSGWYAFYRVGANSVNNGAFRMLDVSF